MTTLTPLSPPFTMAAWVHTIAPTAFEIPGLGLPIRWYGLSYIAAFIIGALILTTLAKRRLVLIPPDRVWDAMFAVILGTVVGGRLGYVLIYDRELLTSFTGSFPFWGLFAINRGGMASHGGLIGLVTAAWWVSRGWRDEHSTTHPPAIVGRSSTLHVMDCLAVMAPPGLLLGRLANFVNGELLGAIVAPPGQPGPWWAVKFPQELRGWSAPGVRDPLSHTPALTPELEAKLWTTVSSVRLGDESWSNALDRLIARPTRHVAELTQVLSSRHPSQLYQAVAEGLVVGAVCWMAWAKPRKPGVVAAWFFISYGVLRVLTEVWRLPDAQFGAAGRILGLSRGQWLSVGMVAVGIALLAYAVRQSREKLGGWAQHRTTT